MVLATGDVRLEQLWGFITQGRSLAESNDFTTYSDELTIGFLTIEEQRDLIALIEHHFGTLNTMRDNHHPQSSGLEYVLQAINDAEANVLITQIDK